MKLVLALSLDGRIAFSQGGKTQIGGQADREVLEEALAWADCTLMGAETLRAHESTCLIHNDLYTEQRSLDGKSQQPISIIVSNKLAFNADWFFFQQPIQRWVISQNESNLSKKLGFDKKILMAKSWQETLLKLNGLGISRIALLGGARLFHSILEEDQIDELQLTITPKLIGGDKTWPPINKDLKDLEAGKDNAWNLKSLNPLKGGEVLLHYLRNRQSN